MTIKNKNAILENENGYLRKLIVDPEKAIQNRKRKQNAQSVGGVIKCYAQTL